ncbi:hypothetical protein [Microbacterium pumilum]|uniref:Baseplate protein J-like domain-containing protein n=1 Tax=Microbacterium pumilum TaxID=344165 RepID=A0ABP5EHJ2_9MICO
MTVLDGFRGLNPQDGLFLRGEHLAAIQDYSRALTSALATASGTGIVHGLDVWIDDKDLLISPGLAISPRGRLLLLGRVVRISLDDLPALPADGYWKVEVHWASDTSGSAPAYGSLCADECADGGSTIRPWRDEGVEVRIVTEVQPGFDGVSDARLRGNWLSSAYFERERFSGQPWLVPGVPDTAIPPLRSRDWTDGTPVPDERGVPLAVIYTAGRSADSGYRVQLWTARRLVDGPAAHATWRSRLAMRPWSVFMAQILQFEAELVETFDESVGIDGADIRDLGDAHQTLQAMRGLFEATDRFINGVQNKSVRDRRDFNELAVVRDEVAASPLARAPLPAVFEFLGFRELPPAGYLTMGDLEKGVESRTKAFFGAGVDVRIRHLRADQIADEVLAAQHRDRIPLRPVGDPPPKVDVLIPSEPTDKATLKTPAYGWAAFVRRGPEPEPAAAPPIETTDVGVYIVEDSDFVAQLDHFPEDRLDKIEGSLTELIGTLRYPKGEWEYPGSDVAERMLAALKDRRALGLLAFARDDGPLAASRAGLFGISLDSGFELPVLAFHPRKLDAIVVVAQPSD